MSEFKINRVKDSFIPFVIIFFVGVIGVMWSDRTIVKSSEKYTEIVVQKDSPDVNSDSDSIAEGDDDSRFELLVPRLAGYGTDSVLPNLNWQRIRGTQSEFGELYKRDKKNIECANNFFVALIISKSLPEMRTVRDELVKNLTPFKIKDDGTEVRLDLLNNLALSFALDQDVANQEKYFHEALNVKNNWLSHIFCYLYKPLPH